MYLLTKILFIQYFILYNIDIAMHSTMWSEGPHIFIYVEILIRNKFLNDEPYDGC
jgi:hypothetical protein